MNTITLALPLAFHRIVLRRLLTVAGYSVIGEASDLAAATASDTIHADFVIVDASLCPVDMDGGNRLRQAVGDRVVVVDHDNNLRRLTLDQLLAVDGIASFDTTSAEGLARSLRLVRAGERVIPRNLMQLPRGSSPRKDDDVPSLSPREADMVRYLVRGAPNKVIARELGISEATVKVHMKGLLRKLGVGNRTQAAIWGRAHGYLEG